MDGDIKNKELAVFWAQSQPTIAAFIQSMVPNFQDADDILQNVAVITVEKFDQFDRERSFSAWSVGIAKNLILKYYSRKTGGKPILDIDTINTVARVYEQDSENIQDRTESMKEALRKKCLKRLKGKFKKLVEMYYVNEFSTARIAQRLNMTRNNVAVTLHRIRLSLRECVEQVLSEG